MNVEWGFCFSPKAAFIDVDFTKESLNNGQCYLVAEVLRGPFKNVIFMGDLDDQSN